MSDINIIYKTQKLVIDVPTATVNVISSGPPGPPGPPGPTDSGGFTFTQDTMPVAVRVGNTWFKTDTGESYVWFDEFWIQYAPGV